MVARYHCGHCHRDVGLDEVVTSTCGVAPRCPGCGWLLIHLDRTESPMPAGRPLDFHHHEPVRHFGDDG